MQAVKLFPLEPVPEVIEHLEELLEKAKSGELVAIAYATEMREGWAGQGWTSAKSIHCLKSGVMTLFARICLAGVEF